MQISALVRNAGASHEVELSTGANRLPLSLPAKAAGGGCAVNGGELLMLALATCFCNDLYREAQRLGIAIDAVEVQASAEFAGRGLSASNVVYRAKVTSPEPAERIEQLLKETDAVAEVHHTLRVPVSVERVAW